MSALVWYTVPMSSNHTNAAIGDRLGLAHSTVSRMRRGERLGSVETLGKIAALAGVTLEHVVAAAELARDGDLRTWSGLLDKVAAPADE